MEQAPLRNCDILVMTSLTQTPTANPDAMIGEFCVNTGICDLQAVCVHIIRIIAFSVLQYYN